MCRALTHTHHSLPVLFYEVVVVVVAVLACGHGGCLHHRRFKCVCECECECVCDCDCECECVCV